MRSIFSKLAFSAGISLALAFTISCSDDDGYKRYPCEGPFCSDDVGNGGSSSSIERIPIPPPSSSSIIAQKSSSSSFLAQSSSAVLKECDAIFNPDNRFCYDGTVYDKCGGKIYDPTTQVCKAGKIEDKCGGSQYNQTTQFCYDGIIYDKCKIKQPFNDPNNPNNYISYNPLTQGCVNNKIVETRCGSGWYDQEKQFCNDGIVYAKCDGMEYPPATHICQNGVAVPAKCGGESYNPVTQYCYNNAIYSKCGSAWYNQQTQFCENNGIYNKCNKSYDIQTQYCSNGTVKNYGYITDTRDGKKYKTVIIGNQIWTAENLNYAAEGSKCYNDSTAYCDKYGRLYDWETVCPLAPYSDNCYGAVICPKNWRLPDDTEWEILIKAVGGNSAADTKLKATSGWDDNYPEKSSNGTDDFGFAALPGGGGDSRGGFSSLGNFGEWWICYRNGSSCNHLFRIIPNSTYNEYYKGYYSVRCMVDKPREEFCNYGTCVGGSGSSCKSGGCFRMPTDDDCDHGTLVSTCPSGTKPPEADW